MLQIVGLCCRFCLSLMSCLECTLPLSALCRDQSQKHLWSTRAAVWVGWSAILSQIERSAWTPEAAIDASFLNCVHFMVSRYTLFRFNLWYIRCCEKWTLVCTCCYAQTLILHVSVDSAQSARFRFPFSFFFTLFRCLYEGCSGEKKEKRRTEGKKMGGSKWEM